APGGGRPARIQSLGPRGSGGGLSVGGRPRGRRLGAGGERRREVRGALTERVPFGARAGECERARLSRRDGRVNARAAPLEVRIEMLELGPGVESAEGGVAQLEGARNTLPAALQGARAGS